MFEPHSARRIVLATNVAETSLTVPGIRYVVDAGTARVKRYSYRNKVEQLPIEPISQAAANQRAGRCGRVADGICIRLYDEEDFAVAAALHRPGDPALVARRRDPAHEVAAASAAVEDFPFLEPPPRRAIADGYQLLNELGAVDDANELTPIGRELARLPLDPRVGRMILEARDRAGAARGAGHRRGAVSVQDVRDRPLEQQQAGRPGAREVRRREVRVPRLPEAVELARGSRAAAMASTSCRTASTSSCCATTSSRRAACANGATSIRSCRRSSPSTAGGSTTQPADLRAAAPVDARRPARQHRLKSDEDESYLGARGIRSSAIRARTCRRSRAAGSSPPSWSRRRGCTARGIAASSRSWLQQRRRPPAQEAAARAALGEEGRAR